MRRLLASAFLAALFVPAAARGAAPIEGTIWPTRAEARRADVAREREVEQAPTHHGLFDFLGSPGMRRAPAPTRPATQAAVTAPPPRVQPGVTDAVVFVRGIPEAFERRLAQQARRDRSRPYPRMIIQKSRYRPRVMAIAAGTELEFQNLDRIWHSTFSVSSASHFDLGKLKPGTIDTVTLARPGVINLHCDIHPDEVGFVVIAPNHAIARPDSLGRFTLPRLPEGIYQIEIWHPVRGNRVAELVVPRKGRASCNLAF